MMKKIFKSPIGFTILLVIVVTLIQSATGRNALVLDLAGEELRLMAGEEYSLSIPYAEIEKIELGNMPELGRKISGDETRNMLYGVYENELWGEYEVCTATNCDLCLTVYGQGKVYIISYESDETTKNLAEAIPRLMAENGYEL